MTSAWGNSWGNSWGASWGFVAFTSSGGDASSTYVSAGTAWNPSWSSDYGPDVDRAKKADREEVAAAVETLSAAPDLEPIEAAQELARRSLASEMMSEEADKVVLLTAYYEYQRFVKRRARFRRAAGLLLL